MRYEERSSDVIAGSGDADPRTSQTAEFIFRGELDLADELGAFPGEVDLRIGFVLPSDHCSEASHSNMELLAFTIARDEEAGFFVASWDDPDGGGITTQAASLVELTDAIKESVRCHFIDRTAPREVTLHFEDDPVLQLA